jgi:hypothetical protein
MLQPLHAADAADMVVDGVGYGQAGYVLPCNVETYVGAVVQSLFKLPPFI